MQQAQILMVEDDKDWAAMFAFLMKRAGHESTYQLTVSEGIDYIKNYYQSIDILMLDYMLPDGTALTLLQAIQPILEIHPIPVVIQSGAIESIDHVLLRSLGVQHFLYKPYRYSAFLDILYQVLPHTRQSDVA